MNFTQLGLKPEILKAVTARGYKNTTPIQAQAIPAILKGKDILGGAQTGTGKTAAFALPILDQLSGKRGRLKHPRALVLAPTRELADQVGESFTSYGKYLPLRSQVVYGGVGISPQIAELKKGTDILVATPGRLLDHLDRKTLNLQDIEILVLDEADRMLDMGFIRDIKRVLSFLPKKRQNLLFSATYDNDIKKLAGDILHNPLSVEVAPRNTAAEKVDQLVYFIDKPQKRHLLAHLIKEESWEQVLVFVRTKHGADRLAKQLTRKGIQSAAIHGDKSNGARTKALSQFKNGKSRVLVATDIAARGIHLDNLNHVVNFDLPQVPEDYVHRIGRTGRAGKSGSAVSLIAPEERKQLTAIERILRSNIPIGVAKGFKPVVVQQQNSPRTEKSLISGKFKNKVEKTVLSKKGKRRRYQKVDTYYEASKENR